MCKIDGVMLFFNDAKNAAIALAKVRLFKDVKGQKNKLKCIVYFIASPKYRLL